MGLSRDRRSGLTACFVVCCLRMNSCRCPLCPFRKESAQLCHARRAVRGHLLREHQSDLTVDGDAVPLALEDCEERIQRLRLQQMNSSQRRAWRARVDGGGEVPGVPGEMSGASGGPVPVLSAGQVALGVDDLGLGMPDIELVLPETPGPYLPPSGFSPSEMANFLADVMPMRTPADVVRRLCGEAGDPAAHYWLKVVADLQRRMYGQVASAVNDAQAVEGTAEAALRAANSVVDRWGRRPLDREDRE